MAKSLEEKNWIKFQIELVVEYLDTLGVMVEFGGQMNAYFFDDDLITIARKQSYKSRLYTLLHEAGHVRLRRRDPERFSEHGNAGARRRRQRIEILHEEFLAWDEGYVLSEELNLNIEHEDWVKFSQKNLYDYITWAYSPKLFREQKNGRAKITR